MAKDTESDQNIGKFFRVENDPDETGFKGQTGECLSADSKKNVLNLKFKSDTETQLASFNISNLTMTGPGSGDGVLFPGELNQGKMICKTMVTINLPSDVNGVEVMENKKKGRFVYHLSDTKLGEVLGVATTLAKAEKEFKKSYKKKLNEI